MTDSDLEAIRARLRGRQAEAAQVAADDDYWPDRETIAIFNDHAPTDIAALIAHVRALAAELLAHKGALHEESLESDQWQLKCNALEAEIEALRKERDEYRAALTELAGIVQGHLDDGDKLDSFTLQPAREVLKTIESPPEGIELVRLLLADEAGGGGV